MTHQPKKRHREMSELVIREISAVDFPAQEGAVATLIKRRTPTRKDKTMRVQKRLTALVNKGRAGGLSGTQALRQLRKQMDPAAFEKFRRGSPARAVVAKRIIRKADREWERAIEDIMSERNVDRHEAWQILARERPDLLQEYQLATAEPEDEWKPDPEDDEEEDDLAA